MRFGVALVGFIEAVRVNPIQPGHEHDYQNRAKKLGASLQDHENEVEGATNHLTDTIKEITQDKKPVIAVHKQESAEETKKESKREVTKEVKKTEEKAEEKTEEKTKETAQKSTEKKNEEKTGDKTEKTPTVVKKVLKKEITEAKVVKKESLKTESDLKPVKMVVAGKDSTEKKVEKETEKKVEKKAEEKVEKKTEKKVEENTVKKAEKKVEQKTQEKTEAKTATKKETKTETKTETKAVKEPVKAEKVEKTVEKKDDLVVPAVVKAAVKAESAKIDKKLAAKSTEKTAEKTAEKTVEKASEKPVAVPKAPKDLSDEMVSGINSEADAMKAGEDWDMIKEFRAEKCCERPDPLHHEDCMKFMAEICNPGGKDGKEGDKYQMDGEGGENPSGKGYCEGFYKNVNAQIAKENGEKPEEEKKEEKEEKKEEPKKEEKKEEAHDKKQSPEAPPADSKYGNFQHNDGETTVSNWRREYGPRAGETVTEICKKYDENEWCKQHSGAGVLSLIVGFGAFCLF